MTSNLQQKKEEFLKKFGLKIPGDDKYCINLPYDGLSCIWTWITTNFELKRSSRSNRQNRYYWGTIVKILSDDLGYHTDEIHEILKYKFLDTRKLTVNNEKIPVRSSTTRLNTKEFEEFVGKVRVWASAELGIFIPEPNEYDVK